jgi:hypothetical protein
MGGQQSTGGRAPRWVEGTANRVLSLVFTAILLGVGLWAAGTAPGMLDDERRARAAGPPVDAVAVSTECAGTSRASSCGTRFRYTHPDGTSRSFRTRGAIEAGTVLPFYVDLSDPGRAYRADRDCCESSDQVVLAAFTLGAGGLFLAAVLLPRRSRRG